MEGWDGGKCKEKLFLGIAQKKDAGKEATEGTACPHICIYMCVRKERERERERGRGKEVKISHVRLSLSSSLFIFHLFFLALISLYLSFSPLPSLSLSPALFLGWKNGR